MSFEIIQINRVPKIVQGHDFVYTRHIEEEVVGYCIKKHLHQAQINQVAVQLYTDETLSSPSQQMFIQVVAGMNDVFFYLHSPMIDKNYKILGRQI